MIVIHVGFGIIIFNLVVLDFGFLDFWPIGLCSVAAPFPSLLSFSRGVMKSKGADGAEDATASAAIAEMMENFHKEFPETWSPYVIDEQTVSAYTDAKTAEAATVLKSVSLCGCKEGSVYIGLDNCGIPSMRLQAQSGWQWWQRINHHTHTLKFDYSFNLGLKPCAR